MADPDVDVRGDFERNLSVIGNAKADVGVRIVLAASCIGCLRSVLDELLVALDGCADAREGRGDDVLALMRLQDALKNARALASAEQRG